MLYKRFKALIKTLMRLNSQPNCEAFGGWSVPQELYNYTVEHFSKGSVMLEFGSGWASEQFSKHFEVYSVEHDKNWLNRYQTHYIYAPIKNHWYDVEVLKPQLPKQYDLILVDGPTGNIGREGFLQNIQLFQTDVPVLFDDVDRPAEFKLMTDFADMFKRTATIVDCEQKKFGIVSPA